MAGFWDSEEPIREISKGETSKYCVHYVTRQGNSYINVREWYCTRNDPTWKPAKAGMAIPLNEVGIELAETVLNAMKTLKEGK